MRITKITLDNYRTLQDATVSFPSFYSPMSGKNDAGKTNVVRAIQCILEGEDHYGMPGRTSFVSVRGFHPSPTADLTQPRSRYLAREIPEGISGREDPFR